MMRDFAPDGKKPDDAAARRARAERWRPRALAVWTVVGVFVAVWLVLGALGFVLQALQLILVGAVVGYMCSPLTNFLEDHRVPRGAAALLSLIVFLAGVAALFLVVGGPLAEELLKLLREVPGYFEQIQAALSKFWSTWGESADPSVRNTVNALLSTISSSGVQMASELARTVSAGLVGNITSLVEDATTFFLGLVLAYWIAKDYPRMAREVALIVGPDHSGDVTLMLAVLSRSVGGYMYGTLITSIANGVMVAAGLALAGHPYAAILGALTFVMHFIPVIGPALSAILATLLALFVSPALAVVSMIIMMVAQNVADNVLSPIVMQRAVQIHPALSLVGIIVGGCLGGALGMVMAVPLTAALRGFFVYFFETRTGRQIVSREGALFQGTPYVDAQGRPLPELDALDDADFFEGSRLAGALTPEDLEEIEGHTATASATGVMPAVGAEDPSAMEDDGR